MRESEGKCEREREAEDSIASRIKRRKEHNKVRRGISTDQRQDDDNDENDSYEY